MTQPEPISLRDAAEELDVHYMTAYRYIRTGRLAAEKRGGRWWIDRADLAQIVADSAEHGVAPRPRTELVDPLVNRLATSDFNGSWQIVEGALASGATPAEVHQELLGPAMTQIGERWRTGEFTIAHEHRATATCHRLLGRLSASFRPRGRRRGTVVLGVISGDTHGFPSAMLADMLEAEHLSVIDLGGNTPVDSFIEVANDLDDLVGIGVATSIQSAAGDAANACQQLKAEFPQVTIVLGGAGLRAVPLAELQPCADVISRSADDACQAFVTAAAAMHKAPSIG